MSEFKDIINGYKYNLISEIEYDGELCSADIKVEKYGQKITNGSDRV